jgi:hypothetical protein
MQQTRREQHNHAAESLTAPLPHCHLEEPSDEGSVVASNPQFLHDVETANTAPKG